MGFKTKGHKVAWVEIGNGSEKSPGVESECDQNTYEIKKKFPENLILFVT